LVHRTGLITVAILELFFLPGNYVDPVTGMEFVRISKGTFLMGSPPTEPKRGNDEQQQVVTISKDFWMGRTEVTQEQWKIVTGNNPSFHQSCGPKCPVENVTWFDVQDFLKRLNQRTHGSGYRLPTEAEWEYACRAGTTTAYSLGDTLTTKDARFDANDGPVPVSTFTANPWGLFDMHGNVWEWTSDWYDNTQTKRLIRGGSWYFGADSARCALRYTHAPYDRGFSLGFRVVKEG
jgi:formylglycine-generating enzyme required for sulfatase activity